MSRLLLALRLKTYVGVFPEQLLGLDQASNGFWGAPGKSTWKYRCLIQHYFLPAEKRSRRHRVVGCSPCGRRIPVPASQISGKMPVQDYINHPEVNTAKSGICILYYFKLVATLWWTNIAIEHGHLIIVDFPINSMVDLSMAKCGCSPEGTPQKFRCFMVNKKNVWFLGSDRSDALRRFFMSWISWRIFETCSSGDVLLVHRCSRNPMGIRGDNPLEN